MCLDRVGKLNEDEDGVRMGGAWPSHGDGIVGEACARAFADAWVTTGGSTSASQCLSGIDISRSHSRPSPSLLLAFQIPSFRDSASLLLLIAWPLYSDQRLSLLTTQPLLRRYLFHTQTRPAHAPLVPLVLSSPTRPT